MNNKISFKKIEKLQEVYTDAYDYYYEINNRNKLFEKMFFDDNLLEGIKNGNKHFIIGDKGSGKTAYAVHISNKSDSSYSSKIKKVSDTIYEKFVVMKRDGMLQMSTYKNIWSDILLLIISKEIYDSSPKNIFMIFSRNNKFLKEYRKLEKDFDKLAFKPEIPIAFESIKEIINSNDLGLKTKIFDIKGEYKNDNKIKSVYSNYELSLSSLERRFEKLLLNYKPNKMRIIFLDGLDARPSNIDTELYRDCIRGLAEAVVELNNGILNKINTKIRVLIRPDIMYTLSIHNMNQIITNNSVVLDWCTTYKQFYNSNIFKVADSFFSKQQNDIYSIGTCWNYYFPYKVRNRHSFLGILDRTFYKPRDILTICNLLISKKKGNKFKYYDIFEIERKYSEYVKGELKDYMLVYLNYDEYEFFEKFIKSFEFKQFTYEEYCNTYNNFISENKIFNIPQLIKDKTLLLQTMYDASLICMVEYNENKTSNMKWSYKEKGYTNIRPSVKSSGNFQFHTAYAKAFHLKDNPDKREPVLTKY